MPDIMTANYLTPSFLTQAVKEFIMSEEGLIGRSLLPIKETSASELKIKITKHQRTPIGDVAPGAKTPVAQISGDNLVKYSPIPFREKVIMDGTDYMKMLSYIEGFKNVTPSDSTFFALQEKGAQLAEDIVKEVALGVIASMEKAIFDSLSGTLVTDHYGSLDYNFAAARKPSAGTAWSVSATATPLDDLRTWVDLFRGSGYKAGKILMNKATYNEFITTAQLKGVLAGTESGVRIQIVGRKVTEVEEIELGIYDEGYINGSGTWTPYLPDGKVLIAGRPAIGAGILGNFALTPSEYNNFAPGIFVNILHQDAGDPPSFRIIGGYNGLPVHHFDDGAAVVYASV